MDYAKKFNDQDKNTIQTAYELGKRTHAGQMRKTGQLFFTHPLTIACMMIQYQPDAELIAATLLHDTIEDTPITIADIQKISPEIASLVE
jgi:(p)ppGpp synthase/HD superfamily hydrolase